MSWLHRTRLRVMALALGLLLAGVGLLSIWTVPAWPVVGVAVAAVAVAVNTMASRLAGDVCLNCGHDLKNQPKDTYGTVCQKCGSVQATTFARLARLDLPEADRPLEGDDASGGPPPSGSTHA